MIAGLLFDKDGTLFDFNRTWASVVETVLGQLTDDPEIQSRLCEIGGFDRAHGRFLPGALLVVDTTHEIATVWQKELPHLSVERIETIANKAGEKVAAIGGLAPACDDLPGLLGTLRAEGLMLGVATHDAEESARQQLAAVGALEQFELIAGYDSGYGFKPEPGMLNAFCAVTGLKPGQVAIIGDSPGDLAMRDRGGMAAAVGVLTGPATEADLAPHADVVLPSINDLPRWLATVNA